MKSPNILLLITDHQAWHQHIAPTGVSVNLPAWRQFCEQAVRFERAYSSCPLCTPARASMMTGVHPHAHGLMLNTDGGGEQKEFHPGQQLYSHHLSRAGYRNAYVGKWHCGHARLPMDYGIEGWSLPEYGKVYMSDAYQAYAKRLGLGDARARIEHCVDHPDWEGQTLILHHESPWRFMNASGVLEGPPEAHEAQFVAHLACEKIRELSASSQPFSLVASFWAPHQPYYPSEPFASMIDPATIQEYPSFRDDLAGRPLRHLIHRERHHPGAKRWRDWSVWQHILARAYGQQIQTDAAIGKVLETLQAHDMANDTLVIWCADHGDALASHGGLWDKGATMTEEVMRVPLAVRWPAAFAGGATDRRLVSNLDVTATMLEAAGADIPREMHSRSLLSWCLGQTCHEPGQVVAEHHGHAGTHIIQRMMVRGQYKYVAALYDGDELYDLESDPFEQHNLIADPAFAAVGHEMRRRLIEHIEHTGDHVAQKRLLVALEYMNSVIQ